MHADAADQFIFGLPQVNRGQYLQETVCFLWLVPRRCLPQDSSAPISTLAAAMCSQLASEISFGLVTNYVAVLL